MEALTKIDTSALEARARQCVRAGDVDGLGNLIAEAEQQHRDFFRQAQEEDRLAREAAREVGSLKTGLAFLPKAEARTRHQELAFKADFHGQRARACQQEGEAADRLLKNLRKLSEGAQALVLTARSAQQAVAVQEQIAASKSALQPLLDAVERAYRIVRTIEEFNLASRSVKIPSPTLHGDVGAINKIGQIRLELPAEWRALARNEVRIRYTMPYRGRPMPHGLSQRLNKLEKFVDNNFLVVDAVEDLLFVLLAELAWQCRAEPRRHEILRHVAAAIGEGLAILHGRPHVHNERCTTPCIWCDYLS